jgi:cation diffusion facilitator CzcD-associated flavoprotein CzcO
MAAELDHEVVIVGSGFSGLGAAIKLRQIGIEDFTILEKADDLGGTWRDNDYPGLAVDMPSFIYCYPFEMSAHWSRVYPPRDEIKAYADHCAAEYDVRSHIRFGKTVVETTWDPQRTAWLTRLDDGEIVSSRYFVSASGLLVEPKLPEIEGIERFEGKLLHSARWDHDYDLTGKRVAVIGTGATAVQLIPAIVDRVAQLDVYQRTPIWLMGKPDPEIPERWQRRFRRFPLLQRAVRWAINALVELTMGPGFVHYKQFPWLFGWLEKKLIESIRSQVDDPEIQEKLIPKYSFFCKRPSFSNVYYPVFNREHVELVTEPIERIGEGAIVARDEGRTIERAVDAIVCASYFSMIDTQTRHLARCLREARRRGANYIEVEQAAHDRDFAKVNRRRESMVLYAGRCAGSNSYYFDRHGDAPGLRPVSGLEHYLKSLFFPLRDYTFEQHRSL